jgi:hypothetical protein
MSKSVISKSSPHPILRIDFCRVQIGSSITLGLNGDDLTSVVQFTQRTMILIALGLYANDRIIIVVPFLTLGVRFVFADRQIIFLFSFFPRLNGKGSPKQQN